MESQPVPDKKRIKYERLIRIVDIFAYSAVIIGGIGAGWFTPASVTREMAAIGWIIPLWAFLLLFGGVVGLIGRLTRVWIIEPTADIAALVGILMYSIVLGSSLWTNTYSMLAIVLILVAGAFMLRRYFELQIFGSDPRLRTFRGKLTAAVHRKTSDFPIRTS